MMERRAHGASRVIVGSSATRCYPALLRGDEPLGEWLVRRQLIDRYQLFEGLSFVHACGVRIGDALVRLGYVERWQVEQEVHKIAPFLRTTAYARVDPRGATDILPDYQQSSRFGGD